MTVYVLVLVVYLGALASIGVVMSSRSKSAGDFAIGGRSVGPWVTALSFVAAYYSSVVIIGGGAFGWRFGLSTLWVGARLPLDGDIAPDGRHAWHRELDDRKDHVGTVGPHEGSKKREPHDHAQADFRDLAHRSLPLGFKVPRFQSRSRRRDLKRS